jgi:hypothetical protein
MYQFSLQWYQALATLGIENAPSAQEMEKRIENLISYFTYNLYSAVCRGVDIHLLRCARITIGFAPASYGSFFRMSEEINPL